MSGMEQDATARLLDLYKTCKAAKRFEERPIDNKALDTILEAARLAPSANNSQPWRFHVYQKPTIIRDAAGLVGQTDLGGAAVLIAAAADEAMLSNRFREQPFMMIDVPIALSHIVLQAWTVGLATRIVWEFEEDKISKYLDIPSKHKMVALVFLGFASEYEDRPGPPPSDFIGVDKF